MPVIITQFKFEQVGAEEVTAELANQKQLESQVVAEVNKANTAFAQQTKIVGEDAKATEALATAMKKIPQALAGQSIRQMEGLSKSIKEGTLQIDAFRTASELAKKQLQQLAPESAQFKRLQAEIKASIIASENLSKSFSSTKGELRAMRETLLQLEDAGHENTDVFRNLSIEAGKLEDAAGDAQARIKTLASDTFKFDAAIGAVQGLTAAFSIGQGVIGLFGDESEEIQKTLLKVNSAMAILTGLQQIQNTIQRQTAVTLAVENALRKIGALSTNLQAASESRFTIVRFLATKAQLALNAAMAANPATVLLVAIGALAGVLLYLANTTDDAAEAQEELARQTEFANQSLRNQVDIVNSLADADQRQIQRLQASGATAAAIRAATIATIDAQIARQTDLIESLRERSGVEEEFDAAVLKRNELRSQREIALLNDQKDRQKEFEELQQKNKEVTIKFLDDIIAANDIAVIEARNGFDRLVAQIEAIQARLRKTLATTDLGANERVLAELEATEKIKQARQELVGDSIESYNQIVEAAKLRSRDQVLINATQNQQILQDNQAAAQANIAIAEEEAQRRALIREQIFDSTIQLANSLAQSTAEIARNQAQAELDYLQTRLDKGLISQEQYDQEVTKIRRRQAAQEKENAIFTATINAAAAIIKVFSSVGPPLSFILAGVTAASTLAQIAAIRSRPLPAFKKGTRSAPGGESLIGEAGAELYQQSDGRMYIATKPSIVDLDPGAKVFTASDTAKMLNNNMFLSSPGYHNQGQNAPAFDYGKMGKAIAKELQNMPLNEVNFDERGFSIHQGKISDRAMRQANRYKIGI